MNTLLLSLQCKQLDLMSSFVCFSLLFRCIITMHAQGSHPGRSLKEWRWSSRLSWVQWCWARRRRWQQQQPAEVPAGLVHLSASQLQPTALQPYTPPRAPLWPWAPPPLPASQQPHLSSQHLCQVNVIPMRPLNNGFYVILICWQINC